MMSGAITVADPRMSREMTAAFLPPRGRYDLKVLPPGDLIVTTLAGFFSMDQVAAYADTAERLIRRCSFSHGSYRILIDITKCAIQSQDVTVAFAQHVMRVPRSRRVAVVTKKSIIRMQIRRIVARPELAVFENVADALSWLDAVEE